MSSFLSVIKREDCKKYLNDPEVVTVEILFLLLSLCNIFVMFRLFCDVIPFPIFVTWWQLTQGLGMAYILGLLGKEYEKLAYFPVVEIKTDLLLRLFFQTLVYIGMVVLSNIVLSKITFVGTFPVVICFTVVLHHVTRFVACGEEYLPLRWCSMLIILIAFIIGCTDTKIVSSNVLPFTLLYACFSAAFRACYLQKIMHIVEGKGSTLHNHQHLIAVCVLPILCVLSGEYKNLNTLPYNFSSIYTWQVWGCLIAVGTIPFLKNIVSNRLIRRTGQAPWRILEILSILIVFLFGLYTCAPSWQGCLSTFLVILGRLIGMYDILSNTQSLQDSISSSGDHCASNYNTRDRYTSDELQSSTDRGSHMPFLSSIEEDQDGQSSYPEQTIVS